MIAATALAVAAACLPSSAHADGTGTAAQALWTSSAVKDDADPASTANCQSADTGVSRDLKDGYWYCGQYWRLSKLPIKFVLRLDGLPSSLAALPGDNQTQFQRAAEAAAAVWDGAATVSGTRSDRGACTSERIVCIEKIDNMAVVNPLDGVNVIKFDSFTGGDYVNAGGVANVTYCTGSPLPAGCGTTTSANRIADVDIQLNSALCKPDINHCTQWYWAGEPLATGVAGGAVASLCSIGGNNAVCPYSLDVESVLMHEIGHALGLGHPGYYSGPGTGWPSDGADAANYNLVMYPRYFPNNATQRALGWGDVLGLQAVLQESQNHS